MQLKIHGVNYDVNSDQTNLKYNGVWHEIFEDQEGAFYIFPDGKALYLDVAAPTHTDTEGKGGHTSGPLFVNEAGHPDSGRIQIGSAKDWICEMYHNPDDEANAEENERQTKANAARIVTCWNEFEMAQDLLSDFVKQQNDPTYGDLVWRLAVKEKAEALLRRTGGTF